MDTTTTALAPVQTELSVSIVAIVGKNGKVNTSAEKAFELLNNASVNGVLSAAVNGKGIVKKTAIASLSGLDSVDKFIASESIDGGKWADFLALLVGEFGPACYNRATQKGKTGADQYMALVCKNLSIKFDQAEFTDTQERVEKQIARAETVRANVSRLAMAYLTKPE